MKELNFINTWLGGHAITLKGLRKILNAFPGSGTNGEVLIICEIGCGGGDNLKVIDEFCAGKDIPVKLIGIDINPDCIGYAKRTTRLINAEWITADYKDVELDLKPHIIFNSLFCHHFNDGQMVEILEWMKKNATMGFFINDLHRHALAYYSIKSLTRIFSRSYLVKNDAPLSVLRGFKRNELESYLNKAGITDWTVEWKWAFRWLVVGS